MRGRADVAWGMGSASRRTNTAVLKRSLLAGWRDGRIAEVVEPAGSRLPGMLQPLVLKADFKPEPERLGRPL
jgi:hypothetical protein